MFVCWGSDDGVDFAAESEFYGGFYGVARDAARSKHPVTVLIRITAAESPRSDRNRASRRNSCNLIFCSNHCDFGVQRLRQRSRRDLRADSSGIAQSYSQSRPVTPFRTLPYYRGQALLVFPDLFLRS